MPTSLGACGLGDARQVVRGPESAPLASRHPPLLGNNPKLLHPVGERHRRGVDQHLQAQLSALGASVELKVHAAAHPGSATKAACASLVAHLPRPAHLLRS